MVTLDSAAVHSLRIRETSTSTGKPLINIMAKLLFRRFLTRLENFLMYSTGHLDDFVDLLQGELFVALGYLAQYLKQLWTYFGIKNHLR